MVNNPKPAVALVSLLATMATTLLISPAALAQRTVPFNGNNPVAPQGISKPRLGGATAQHKSHVCGPSGDAVDKVHQPPIWLE